MRKIDFEKVAKKIKYIPLTKDWSNVPSEKCKDLRKCEIAMVIKNTGNIIQVLKDKYCMYPVMPVDESITDDYVELDVDFNDTTNYPYIIIYGNSPSMRQGVVYSFWGLSEDDFNSDDYEWYRKNAWFAETPEQLYKLIEFLYTDEVYISTAYHADHWDEIYKKIELCRSSGIPMASLKQTA